jgi:hypothetical protein
MSEEEPFVNPLKRRPPVTEEDLRRPRPDKLPAGARIGRLVRKRYILPSPTDFCRWMKVERELCIPRLGLRELAEMTGLTRSRCHRIESRLSQPSLEHAWRIWLVIVMVRAGKLDYLKRRIMKSWTRI